MECTHWKLKGSAGEPIHGSTHQPEAAPNGVILIGHGFKGYKDYGMFPWLANQLAEHGLLVHRFNYSHSGMLAQDGPFERPDLFELDTWNRQVEDLTVLTREFHIEELPLTILGHSRGGVACLLAAGRGVVQVDRVISLSAPATCNPLTSEMQETLLSEGFLESPSSRTSQLLRIGKCFLQEQLDDLSDQLIITRGELQTIQQKLILSTSKTQVLEDEAAQITDARPELKSVKKELVEVKEELTREEQESQVSQEKYDSLATALADQNRKVAIRNTERIKNLKDTTSAASITAAAVPLLSIATLIQYTRNEIKNYCNDVEDIIALENKAFGEIKSIIGNIMERFEAQCR